MLGRTHIAVGVAAALAVVQPDSAAPCALAVVGGAVGGLLPDFDQPDKAHRKGVLLDVGILAVLVSFVLGLDWVASLGGVSLLLEAVGPQTVAGLIAFLALVLFGATTPHRSFTHSVVFVAAMGAASWMISAPLVVPLIVGVVSHVAIDLLNRQGLALLWPFPQRLGLGLCRADGVMNRAFGTAGVVFALVYLINVAATTVGVGLA